MITLARPDGTITTTEAAKRLGVARASILNWFEAGTIRGWRNVVSRRVWIYETEIARRINDGTKANDTDRSR